MVDIARITEMHQATVGAAQQAALDAAKQLAAVDEAIKQQYSKKPKKG
jgi:hypothetical protein